MRFDRRVAWVAAAVLALPALVLLVRVLHGGWLASADLAAIEVRIRDVGTRHTPLLGPYSRYGWNHPGPLLFYVLAPLYRLLGSADHGMLVGALALNVLGVVGIVVVLWRRGRFAGVALGLAAVLLLVRALGAGFLVDPWNPYIIVLPLFALVGLAWAATDGDRWALPIAIGVGSFIVQSHVGAALAVLAPVAVAVVVVAVDARHEGIAALRPVAVSSIAVAIVCWIAPIVQQFQPGGGNLGDLARFWMHSHSHTTGWSAGARIVGQQLSIPAPWLTGSERVLMFTGGVGPQWHVPIALLLLIGAVVVAVRRRDRQALVLDVLAVTFVLAAVFSAAHIIDAPYDYIVRWIWVVGPLVWLAIAWTLGRALPRDLRRKLPAVRALLVVVAVLTGWIAVDAVHADFPDRSDDALLARIAPTARRALRELPGPVLVTAPPDFHSGFTANGVLLIAIHAGVDARLETEDANAVGATHTVSEASARSLVVVAVDDATERYRTDRGYRSLAGYDPLSPAERAYHKAVAGEIERALSGGLDQLNRWAAAHKRDRSRLDELDRRGPRIEIFLKIA